MRKLQKDIYNNDKKNIHCHHLKIESKTTGKKKRKEIRNKKLEDLSVNGLIN